MKKTVLACALLSVATLPLDAAAATYKVVPVKNGGSVSGKVTFSGDDPPSKVFAITKDNATCGTGNRRIDFVKVNNGALTEAVVYLVKVKSGKDWPADIGKPLIDQKTCAFHPFMGVMRNGDTISVQNSDPVLHNIHTYEIIGRAKKTVFNVSQPPEMKVIRKKVKLRRGTAMKLECDAHDFMHGYRFVAKSPYFAVVKDDGTFEIDDIPPGNYTIKAWHGFLGVKKGKIAVSTGGKATINFAFKGK